MNLFWRSAVLLNIALLSVLLVRQNGQLAAPAPAPQTQKKLNPQKVTDSKKEPKHASTPQPTTQPSVPFVETGDQVLPLDPAQTQGFEKLEYAELDVNVLRENKIVYKPQLPPTTKKQFSENVHVKLDHYNLYLLTNKKNCPKKICQEPMSREQSPLIVLTDKRNKIVATIQSWWQTKLGGMFSLYKFSGQQGVETLLWSVHTGGANLAFDHFLIELNPSGKIGLNKDFVRSIGHEHLDVRGNIVNFTSKSEILDYSEMRGMFLSLPKVIAPESSFADLLEDSKFKDTLFMSEIPVWPKMAKAGDEEIVLMQIDAPYITFNPLRHERFIYKAVEFKNGKWQDASHLPSAQAFYRQAQADLFKEFSKHDGAIRNWMMSSWAGYKAMLGEWNDAQDIIRVKVDTNAYRKQLCEVFALLDRNPSGGVDAAKILSFINFQANRKIPIDPKCEVPSLISYLEREMTFRGFLRAEE